MENTQVKKDDHNHKKVAEEALTALEGILPNCKEGTGKKAIQKWADTYGYTVKTAKRLLKEMAYEEEYGLFWWHQWEIIRRHSEYRKFCDGQIFDKNKKLQPAEKSSPECIAIKKRFQLQSIFHYSKDFSINECFSNFEIFLDREAVVRIWPDANINKDGPQRFIDQDLPDYGDFIFLGINIAENVKLKDIIAEVHRKVTHARVIRGYELIGRKGVSAFHQDKEVFRVWDLRNDGASNIDIIKSMWPDEYDMECSKEASKKDELYKELCQKYKNQYPGDWGNRAYNEAYNTDDDENSKSGRVKFFVRVEDKLKKMDRLFEQFKKNKLIVKI